jgi:hypothetical protein
MSNSINTEVSALLAETLKSAKSALVELDVLQQRYETLKASTVSTSEYNRVKQENEVLKKESQRHRVELEKVAAVNRVDTKDVEKAANLLINASVLNPIYKQSFIDRVTRDPSVLLDTLPSILELSASHTSGRGLEKTSSHLSDTFRDPDGWWKVTAHGA